ncbi:MAG TPA: GAF domain-containing protein, partial [Terriglobales bacterium]|nr:GAF domain-containing protein [Terriglobales bacterium]
MQGPERHSGITSSRLDDLSSRCDELLGAALPVNGGRNLQEVFSELLRRLEQSLQFDYLGFGLFNPARNVIAVLFQAGEFEVPAEIPVLGSSLGLIVHQQQAIEIADLEVDDRFPDIRELGRLSPYHSLRAVPLATERRQLGGMCVARKTKGAFSEEDVRYIETAAQLVSLVLENALQGHVLRREKARLEALLNISRSVVSTLDLRKLFPGIAASIQRVLGQDFTNLALYDEATGRMRFYIVDTAGDPAVIPPGTAVPLSECPAGVVFREGEVRVFSESDLRQFHSELVDRVLAQGVRSICCLPLISRSKRLGSLGLASTRQGAFSEADLSLLTQIAAQVGLAVDNARAYDEIARFRDKLSNEKQYLESELRAEHNFGEIIGNSETLRDVLKQVEIAAPSDATVLVLGETGTGKELIARAVH